MQATSIYEGILTQAIRDRLDECLGQRYKPSSLASISRGAELYSDYANIHKIHNIIKTGDKRRGGLMVGFVLMLAYHANAYPSSTIVNYVWGFRKHCELNGEADPIIGVLGWKLFMDAIYVMCYVPSEPKKAMPFGEFLKLFQWLHDYVSANHCFRAARTGTWAVHLFGTGQRSELPFPKAYTGPESFDVDKHLRVVDVEPDSAYTKWAVGATKADPRGELEQMSGGRAWIKCAHVDGIFDQRWWLSQYFSYFPPGRRADDAPFFVADDLQRPLRYCDALADIRWAISQAGLSVDPQDYGIHFLRVLAWNAGRLSVGSTVAGIHCGWESSAKDRYSRVEPSVVASIYPGMVNALSDDAASDVAAAVQVQRAEPPSAQQRKASVAARRRGGNQSAAAPSAARLAAAPYAARPAARSSTGRELISSGPSNSLPTGWTFERWRSATGKTTYTYFFSPSRERFESLLEAQRSIPVAPASTAAPVRLRAVSSPLGAKRNGWCGCARTMCTKPPPHRICSDGVML